MTITRNAYIIKELLPGLSTVSGIIDQESHFCILNKSIASVNRANARRTAKIAMAVFFVGLIAALFAFCNELDEWSFMEGRAEMNTLLVGIALLVIGSILALTTAEYYDLRKTSNTAGIVQGLSDQSLNELASRQIQDSGRESSAVTNEKELREIEIDVLQAGDLYA